VEHPCYRCGATVEEGIAFCPQCAAPLIRVALEETADGAGAPPHSLAPPNLSGANAIDWPNAFPSCAWAGLIAGLLIMVPLGASFWLGMLVAGFLAVIFYHRRQPILELSPRMGARLGAASGVFGFCTFALLTSVETLLRNSGAELRAALLEAVRQSGAHNADPKAQPILDFLRTPQGLTVVLVTGFVVMFLAFLVFSAIGGAIGAAMLKKKGRP